MSLLNVQDLTLTLYGASILKQLNFTLEPGEILALTGESGSGKSMTALSLLQLLPDSAGLSGNIYLDGTNLLRLTEPQLCAQRGGIMGMVFQEPMSALNPVQTVGAQVAEAHPTGLHQSIRISHSCAWRPLVYRLSSSAGAHGGVY